MSKFRIEVEELAWIDGSKDNPEDLCLHGKVRVIIGEEKLEYEATVSATALYLLKSLTEDHKIGEDNQMLPCCGDCIIPDAELSNVSIIGCSNGIDWSILHEGEEILLITESGKRTRVSIPKYRQEVVDFVDKIESYYQACSPKILPEDDFTREGYEAFWNEWHRRRGSV